MDSEQLGKARAWLTDYLCVADARIGRTGAVCPFVAPAIQAGDLRLEWWPMDPSASVQGLVSLVRRMVASFEAMQWAGRNRTLHALVAVLGGLPQDRFALVDEAHAFVKPELVTKGLMLGQFHELSDERAARNPDFKTSRSPVPMLALRRMAVHDILFLNADRSCFTAYEQRYGTKYDRDLVRDPLLRDSFDQARARFGPTTTPQGAPDRWPRQDRSVEGGESWPC
ncbi:hypothetical protein OG756_02995 [Streptomyces sp. NBC_01310]|uniref:DUF6875 domain-containing protein n=1 Tax=Streptomyces sp. NBC_01310 TaxID=2903820 RepID=UPI0035B678ED|nr:hypothetical protein OG756_02995 [Streptomyces sp. NBC_01310]